MRDLVSLISPLISTAVDGGTTPVPVLWRTGWRALTLGLGLLAIFWLSFEVGYYAGSQEERAFWAPLEAQPRKWPRLFRPLLHAWQRLTARDQRRREAAWEKRRAEVLRNSGGRHRSSTIPSPGGVPPVAPSGPEDTRTAEIPQVRDRDTGPQPAAGRGPVPPPA